MTQIVINNDYGGFSLSEEAFRTWLFAKGIECWPHPVMETLVFLSKPTGDYTIDMQLESMSSRDIPRDDPDLVKIVLSLGSRANGYSASLKVVTIPDDVEWEIEGYDGGEWIVEKHRVWS